MRLSARLFPQPARNDNSIRPCNVMGRVLIYYKGVGQVTETKTPEDDVPGWDALPGYRKRDGVILLLFLFIPAALVIMWTGPVFVREGTGYRKATAAWKMAMSAIGLGAMLLVFQWQRREAIEAAVIPSCVSSEAENGARDAIDQSPAGKMEGLRLFGLKDAKEASWDPDAQTRICSIVGLTNVGIRYGTMTLSWLDRSRARYYVSVSLQ